VGDSVGDDAADDVWESIAVSVVCLFCPDVADSVRMQDFAETGADVSFSCRCCGMSRSYLV